MKYIHVSQGKKKVFQWVAEIKYNVCPPSLYEAKGAQMGKVQVGDEEETGKGWDNQY